MTQQEAYEKMRAYYTRPDTLLARRNGACMYVVEGDEKQRCAVGCLLPMSFLEKTGEMLNSLGGLPSLVEDHSRDAEVKDAVELLGLPLDYPQSSALYDFLQEAQTIHDDHTKYQAKEDVVKGLDELATTYGLTAWTD